MQRLPSNLFDRLETLRSCRYFSGIQEIILEKLAQEFDAVLVRLQSSIDTEILEVEDRRWSSDMVHPYEWAHAWIARQWLRAVGL